MITHKPTEQFNCPRCNGLNQPGARFCQVCGIQLMQMPSPPPNIETPAPKKMSSGLKAFITIVCLAVLGGILTRSSEMTKEGADQQGQPRSIYQSTPQRSSTNTPVRRAPTSWHQIAKFTGKGTKQTETFTLHSSDEWRINWDTKPGRFGDTNFQIYVYRADGELVSVAANVIGADKDTTVMRGRGSYYLMINTSQPYTITVEANY